MQVHRMEDYRIRHRNGQARGTGNYIATRAGYRKEVTKYSEYYETDAGEFPPGAMAGDHERVRNGIRIRAALRQNLRRSKAKLCVAQNG